MRRRVPLWLGVILLLGAGVSSLPAGEAANEEMEKLRPFVGVWKTDSVFPDNGLRVGGELEYRYVLGGHWLLVRFVGAHPDRSFWEAVAMIRYDGEKDAYVSFDFFAAADPVRMTGRWISDATVRFLTEESGRTWGIDYTIREDGTVYQENWVVPAGGAKKVTLETTYSRCGG